MPTVPKSQYCKTGWPNKSLIPHKLLPYWKARSSLMICGGYNSRIVVPEPLRQEIARKLMTCTLDLHDGFTQDSGVVFQ